MLLAQPAAELKIIDKKNSLQICSRHQHETDTTLASSDRCWIRLNGL